jgi:type I restriction enzyme S subunit
MSSGPTKRGDVVFTTEAPLGNVALIPDNDLYILSQRVVLLRTGPDVFDAGFLQRFLGSSAFRHGIEARATGSTAEGVKRRHLMSMPIAQPPIEEQRAITAFLDREIARIDALVGKKERLIALLQEKRSALITRAVTRGLDPKAPMMDSGVEWVGKIPAHWEVVGCRRLIRRIEQGWSPIAEDRVATADEWAVIKLSAISKGTFVSEEHKALPVKLAPDARYEIRDGDFLVTRANTPDLVGDVCVARVSRGRLMLCDLVYRLDVRTDRVVPHFLAYWFLSPVGRYQIEVDARGSSRSMVKVSQGHIRAWSVVLPPMDEQAAIVDEIERQTAKIDRLVQKVHEAIERTRELRTALISAAVTGKIDVREEVA